MLPTNTVPAIRRKRRLRPLLVQAAIAGIAVSLFVMGWACAACAGYLYDISLLVNILSPTEAREYAVLTTVAVGIAMICGFLSSMCFGYLTDFEAEDFFLLWTVGGAVFGVLGYMFGNLVYWFV